MDAKLECREVRRTFGDGARRRSVLEDVHLTLAAGETCVLLGPSGSGKTTLLSILGCLLSPSRRELRIEGGQVPFEDKIELTNLRRSKIGFVFQHAQLLPFLSLADNLGAVGRNAGLDHRGAARRTNELLCELGLEDVRGLRPGQASGGECQRLAIARALIHEPVVVLADEPTAALDWDNGRRAIELLVQQAKRRSAAQVTVTHDTRLLPYFDRVVRLENGRMVA